MPEFNLRSDSKTAFISSQILAQKGLIKDVECLSRVVILDSNIKEGKCLGFQGLNDFAKGDVVFPQVNSGDIASLIYTSGTTGRPKGVLLSHGNLCSNFIGAQKLDLIFPSDNILSILPLYHTYAFMVTLLIPLLTGAKVTYCPSFKPEDLARLIQEAKVTILVGVPQLFNLMHKAIVEKIKGVPVFLRPFIFSMLKNKVRLRFGKGLRLLASGGARLDPLVGRDLTALGLKIVEGYGLTETSPVVSLNPPDKVKFGSVGKPLPGVEVKIIDPDKDGVGQVIIKGPNVMFGYFKQEGLTKEVIKEGYFYSGDLGYFDKEGYLYLVGRKKDVIVLSSGKNIYPDEVEEHYIKSHFIKEICVLSKVSERFGRKQELLHAVILPDLEYFALMNEKNIHRKLSLELERLSLELSSYKRIMGFTVVNSELPRTRLKKIKRHEVAQKLLKGKEVFAAQEQEQGVGLSDDDLRLAQSDFAKKIIGYLAAEFKRPVSLNSHLEIDLGIDSLSRVELGAGLEALLGISISQELMDRVSTVRDIILGAKDIQDGATSFSLHQRKEEHKNWGAILIDQAPEKVVKKIKIIPSLIDRALAFLFQVLFRGIFKIFWSLQVEGREFIPAKGPYLICPNHASFLDGFFVFSSLSFSSAQDTFFLGYAVFFEHPLVKWIAKSARLIAINPNTHLTDAMQAVSYALRHKKVVCIFPEGTRSIDEEVQGFKKGVGILAKELNIPIIPVYINNSHYSWPRNKKLPRPCPVKVIFGKPLSWQGLGTTPESIATSLREKVVKLQL